MHPLIIRTGISCLKIQRRISAKTPVKAALKSMQVLNHELKQNALHAFCHHQGQPQLPSNSTQHHLYCKLKHQQGKMMQPTNIICMFCMILNVIECLVPAFYLQTISFVIHPSSQPDSQHSNAKTSSLTKTFYHCGGHRKECFITN